MLSKLLIMSESMMPFTSNWGACQRIYHYAKQIMREGVQVTVICHNTSDQTDGIVDVGGITVIGHGGRKQAQTFSSYQESSAKFKAQFRNELKKLDRNVKVVSQIARSVYRFAYSEPNVLSGRLAQKWANTVVPFAIKYIKDKEIDTVILSGPTFGLFYHAAEIKATGIKLILDYRDPWVSWYEKPTLASRSEKRAIECADLVVTTTQTLTDALNRKYCTEKCHTVMNGYDEDMWAKIPVSKHDPNKMIIAYVGNIKIKGQQSFRNPTCFLKAIKEFKSTHPNIKVEFIGVQDRLDEIDAELKECIEFQNNVSVEDSLEFMAKADVLVIFHTALDASGKYIICGKAFDCLRSGNFILSIGDMAYANKAFVEETESGIACDNKNSSILRALNEIYAHWEKKELTGTAKNIKQYSREHQNEKLLQLIQAIK